MTPSQSEVRSRIELDLHSYQERVLPEHLPTISDRGWNRTIGLLRVMQASYALDHAIICLVVETGVEPAKSLGSRPNRFSSLRTRPTEKMAGPGIAPGGPSL